MNAQCLANATACDAIRAQSINCVFWRLDHENRHSAFRVRPVNGSRPVSVSVLAGSKTGYGPEAACCVGRIPNGRQKLLLSTIRRRKLSWFGHVSMMSVVMIRCRSYFEEQWIVVIVEQDLVSPERITSSNGRQCRHCCASQMTEVDGQSC